MKIIILSDSHDNIVRLRHVLGFAQASHTEAIIHCGDWNTPLAVKQFARVKVPVFGVLGNADIDPDIVQSLKQAQIKFNPDFLELDLDGKHVGICHFPSSPLAPQGSPRGFTPRGKPFDVLFYGHTHQKRDEKIGKTRLINPGALHNTLAPSFAVWDTKSDKVEFVDIAV